MMHTQPHSAIIIANMTWQLNTKEETTTKNLQEPLNCMRSINQWHFSFTFISTFYIFSNKTSAIHDTNRVSMSRDCVRMLCCDWAEESGEGSLTSRRRCQLQQATAGHTSLQHCSTPWQLQLRQHSFLARYWINSPLTPSAFCSTCSTCSTMWGAAAVPAPDNGHWWHCQWCVLCIVSPPRVRERRVPVTRTLLTEWTLTFSSHGYPLPGWVNFIQFSSQNWILRVRQSKER